jgi:SAM-dependent methyltransferase
MTGSTPSGSPGPPSIRNPMSPLTPDRVQSESVVEMLDRALGEIDQARAYNDWLFDRARRQLGRRVLDVGAGVGTFTALASAEHANVVAVEPVPEFAGYLRDRFAGDERVEVVQGTVDEVDSEDFDSIICLNVLEHIEDDAATVRRFAQLLIPGGRLFLLVPAHPGLYGGYDRAAGHVRRYSREVVGSVLAGAGLEVETLRHVNPAGAVGWLLRVRLRSSPDWPSGSFAAFDRFVPLLRHLDSLHLPFGLSLWAVARRMPPR